VFGEQTVEVRCDELRRAEGNAQEDEAAVPRGQLHSSAPDLGVGRKLCEPSRGNASTIPQDRFGGVKSQSSVHGKVVLKAPEQEEGTVRGRKDGDIVQVSQHPLPFAQLLLERPDRRPQGKAKQGRHEGVTLFAALTLTDMTGDVALAPEERGLPTAPKAGEGKQHIRLGAHSIASRLTRS
jgi:hypothetical protein